MEGRGYTVKGGPKPRRDPTPDGSRGDGHGMWWGSHGAWWLLVRHRARLSENPPDASRLSGHGRVLRRLAPSCRTRGLMLQRVLRSRLLFGPPIALAVTVRQPNEDVYVYRLRGTPGEMRRVFFRYVEAINDPYAHPRFYNTVTTNQLRDGRAVQPADESGRRAVDVEDPAQRLRAAVRLRHGPARHVAAISGARASCERQRARARRRREPSLRRADSRGPSRAEITMTHRRTQPAAGQVTEGGTSVQAGGWSCRRWRSIRAAR